MARFSELGGTSPDIPITITPASVKWLYRHSSRFHGNVPGWVVASAGEGIAEIKIPLCAKTATPATSHHYTVRLYFAEHEKLKPGQRVFSVSLQEKEIIRDLDIVAETGATNVGLMKELKGVQAAETLSLRLAAKAGQTVLSGIELIQEEK